VGDENADSIINIQDMIIVMNVVLGTETDIDCSDFNTDRVVNIHDIILIVNEIMR